MTTMTTNNKAAVNLSAKDQFARVLATENIHVVHDGKAETASFNTASRVLRLPRWKEMSGQLYDMLVAHEVGHALFTPTDMYAILQLAKDHGVDPAVAKDYVNVVEDARIERLMKQKFPGLRRDFINAYSDLIDRGFFGSEEDQKKYDLIDRINLHYKAGTVGSSMEFDADEESFLNDIDGAETWDDIIRISGELLDYADAQKRQQEEEDLPEPRRGNVPGNNEDESEDEGEDVGRSEPTDEETDDDEESKGGKSSPRPKEEPLDDSPSGGLGRSKSMEKFEDEMERLRDTGYGSDNIDKIVSVPVCDPSDAIIDWTQLYGVEGGIDEHYTDERLQNDDSAEIQQFLEESRKICRGMAQEFVRKQKATAFRRQTIAKTGMLDMERVINYKWSEDIFRKTTILPDGKNHGLVILVDWSGSMANVMQDTVRQAIQMAMFCRLINIPFEVFSFSTYGEDRETNWNHSETSFQWKDENGEVIKNSSLTMRNYLSSRMPKQKFYDACRRMSIMALAFDWGSNIPMRRGDHLGGTPLDDALYVLAHWVPKYRAENSIEILNTLIISDGATTTTPVQHQDVVRDGHHYFRSEGANRYGSTPRALDVVRHRCPGTKLIQFFLHDAKNLKNMGGFALNYEETDKMAAFYKKNKWVISTDKQNFDERFIMFGKNSVQNADAFDEVGRSDSETITKIRNSFVKSMKQTGTSRAMLNRFIDLIA